MSFGKCTAGLGFGLLGKKHLLGLFVLPAQLCEEWGWRGWEQPCSLHLAAVPAEPLSGGCAAPPSPDPLTSVIPPQFSLAHTVLGCLDMLGMVTQLFWCWIWDGRG